MLGLLFSFMILDLDEIGVASAALKVPPDLDADTEARRTITSFVSPILPLLF